MKHLQTYQANTVNHMCINIQTITESETFKEEGTEAEEQMSVRENI